MASKKKAAVQKAPLVVRAPTAPGQQVVLQFFMKPETIELSFKNFGTDFHHLRLSEKVLDKFMDTLDSRTKRGPRYTPQERHNKMVFFITKRIVPVEGNCAAMRGPEYEASIKRLLWEIFKEDFDKDFDALGQNVAEKERIEVENTETGETQVFEAETET